MLAFPAAPSRTVSRLRALLDATVIVAALLFVSWVQNPIRLTPHSEPQPDLAVLGPRSDFYQLGHPQPGEVLLVIEVADSSIAIDRAVKLPLYARAGIGEFWLVDLAGRRVLVHRGPEGDGSTHVDAVSSGDVVRLAAFDLSLTVAEILGT